MRPLVILRPEPGASATAKAARAMGLEPEVMPLFQVEPVEWTPPDAAEFDALLFTSANTVRHGGPGLQQFRALPAHCVGEATAAEAGLAGFDIASVGAGGVESLLQAVPSKLRLLHLCGTDRRIAGDSGRAVTAVEVYRSAELPPPEGLSGIDGAVVAVHSPRSGARFAHLAESAGLQRRSIAVAAISAAAAEAAGAGWETVEAAPTPSDSDLLAIAFRLCNKPV